MFIISKKFYFTESYSFRLGDKNIYAKKLFQINLISKIRKKSIDTFIYKVYFKKEIIKIHKNISKK